MADIAAPASSTAGPVARPAKSRPPARRRSFAPLIVAGLVALIGVAVIGSSTSGGAGMYNYSVADLVTKQAEVSGQNVKVAGTIKTGSVRGEPASESFRFELTDGEDHNVTIAYRKLLPDPFEEGREAIVQGKFEDGVLTASNLTVKCPSRYEDSGQFTAEQKAEHQSVDPKKHALMYKKRAGPAPKSP